MRRAAALETTEERRRRRKLGRMLAHPESAELTVLLFDRAFRSQKPARIGEAIETILATTIAGGASSGLSAADRLLLTTFLRLWRLAPSIAVGAFVRHLRAETRDVVLDAARSSLRRYLFGLYCEGVSVNLNLVGEAILGDEEAVARLRQYLIALADPLVPAVAVKLSSLVANIRPLAHDRSIESAVRSLRVLFDAAPDALITLDMEEFSDLEPTVATYRAIVLDPNYSNARLGIALQAYLPDSAAVLGELAEVGRRRVCRGGVPARVRLVKGANLAMERFIAEERGWPAAPFPDKAETDANMKRMVATAFDPKHLGAMEVGVGSHNVFDIAFAVTIAEEFGTSGMLTIEMLTGMAEPLRRAVAETLGHLRSGHEVPSQLVYAPVARSDDFLAAVAYLVRRLDENTAPQNFLRHAFTMQVGDSDWCEQRRLFMAACANATAQSHPASRRNQDRATEEATNHRPAASPEGPFRNEADTDWTLVPNRRWLHRHLIDCELVELPGEPMAEDVDRAVALAAADPDGWADRTIAQRAVVLRQAATELRQRRGALLGVMVHEALKTPAEADPEVSEAIDLTEYYARSFGALASDGGAHVSPRGVIAVLPPWNFPLAIPLGGVCAALIGGNRVVLKPSPLTSRTAALGASALWDAGVPRSALQLVFGGATPAAALARHPDVDAVVFTGSTHTALRILERNPTKPLFAETGGKNAIVVTATADRDLAIGTICRSVFAHAGQKCSATSLVVAEAEVFDDPAFRRRLVDAAATLRCGPATDPATDVPPLVMGPNPVLAALYERLPDGEHWALRPEQLGERHWSPGVVWDVQEGSPTHLEESFGPIVGVMRAEDLADAVRLVNASRYGLTSGLQSLDPAEWRFWSERVQAGNLYVNRPTTGAIVGRQPFGGWRHSCFGPGAKAGGPNYAMQLCRTPCGDLAESTSVRLHGQHNVWRYRPAMGVVLRIEADDDPNVVRARLAAAHAAGCDITVSRGGGWPADNIDDVGALFRVDTGTAVERIVRCGPAGRDLLEAAVSRWVWVCDDPIADTRRDLLPFLQEQTVSVDTHRYGWVAHRTDDLSWL